VKKGIIYHIQSVINETLRRVSRMQVIFTGRIGIFLPRGNNPVPVNSILFLLISQSAIRE